MEQSNNEQISQITSEIFGNSGTSYLLSLAKKHLFGTLTHQEETMLQHAFGTSNSIETINSLFKAIRRKPRIQYSTAKRDC